MDQAKRKLIDAVIAHAEGERAKHVAQLDVMLCAPVCIPDHTGLFDSIQDELESIGVYTDQIKTLTELYA
jgi:trans-aconitate methyltransferase